MSRTRKLAIAAGVLYLITHVTSIAGLVLYGPVLSDSEYILGPGANTHVLLGALFEVILAMAVIGTAVALFPVIKKHSESIALGYMGLRVLEAATIVVGIVSLLGVVTLRQHLGATADVGTASLLTIGASLVAIHDWTFLVGPNLILATNTVLLAYLMFRSRLVPRFVGVLGLVGGPLIFAWTIGTIFGIHEQMTTLGAIVTIPVFAWELTLAGWLIVKGFNPTVATTNAGPRVLDAVRPDEAVNGQSRQFAATSL